MELIFLKALILIRQVRLRGALFVTVGIFQASSLALNRLSATTATYQCYLFTRTKLLLLKFMVLILALSFGICGSL